MLIMKKILQWMATDGLLHFLVCYAMLLTFAPYVGNWIALGITLAFALGKEAYDVFIEKDNNFSQATHDLICDFAGIVVALLVM
jgi:hypothetical protein